MQQSPLAGSVALVTGAGRGIGRATAIRLAAAGARVALMARSSDQLDATAAAITASGHAALACPGDVAEEEAVERTFDRIGEAFGTVDLLVNNAGAVHVAPLVDQRLADFRRVLDTNLVGAWLCSRALFRRLIAARRPGAIVNLSSLGGLANTTKFAGTSTYAAAKFGVVGLTEVLAVEGRPHGIRVNCVAPGAVDTEMLKQAAPFLKTSTTPADVAESIYFLCDATRSGKLTGVVLPIPSNE